MRLLIKSVIVLLVLAGIVAGIAFPVQRYLAERNRPIWRTVEVVEGDISFQVNATGKVQPVHRVNVGAFVSGPVEELLVDFNDRVKEGQLLARIDSKLYDSAVRRDEAVLSTRRAELKRFEAMLEQAITEERRSKELRKVNPEFMSETEFDALRFDRISREAEVAVAKTGIEQAEANLENSVANLAYTRILAPCDGIIIDRKIDSGQTIAAQFQTPELFTVAPDLDKVVHIEASVDEADIGLIRAAQEKGQPVSFTVDAYPESLFESGKILQVRLSSGENQNVITYPVIVKTPNEEMRLLPGMTANLSFLIEAKNSVVKIPNAALRFYPDRLRVHPDDRKILDGNADLIDNAKQMITKQSAEEKAEQGKNRRVRHVWVTDGEFLRAKRVVTGISDNRFTELLEGDIAKGEQLVTGEQPKT